MPKHNLTVHKTNRLKSRMADAGFRSMEALARETGISKNMLYMFERGESRISDESICRLLWALDCKFEDLIQFEIESNEPDHIDDLSDEVKAAIEQGRAEHRAQKRGRKAS